MTPATLLSFLPILFGLVMVQPGAMQEGVTRLVIQDEIILRVPIAPRPVGPPVRWEEQKGPKCVPIPAIRTAMLSGPDRVDFLFENRQRVRAQLEEDCLGLDFYNGFYLEARGNQLCAGRDAIHSRMGGSCSIKRFRLLVPKIAR